MLAVAGRRPRHRDSPRVRRLAREAGVDLESVTRSGRNGRATAADVAASRSPATAGQARSTQLLTVVEADLTTLTRVARGSVLPFVAEAVVRAFRDASPGPVHLGVADGDAGPAPVLVVRDAGDLTVGGLARHLSAPATDSRGRGPREETTGPTVTVVDSGELAVLIGTASLPAGSGVVLTLGAVVRRPVVLQDGEGHERLAFRSMAYLALSHDAADLGRGAAARRLAQVKRRLESWEPDAALAAVVEVPR